MDSNNNKKIANSEFLKAMDGQLRNFCGVAQDSAEDIEEEDGGDRNEM